MWHLSLRTPAVLMMLVPLMVFLILLVITHSMNKLHHTPYLQINPVASLGFMRIGPVDELGLKEMDLKWHVAMISLRMKKFYKKIGRKLQFDAKEPVGFDKTKVKCYSCHKTGSGKQEDYKALVTIDGEGVDWTSHSEEEEEDYALMACNSQAQTTEKVEAQLVAHQQGQLWYEEKIRFMKIDLDDKTDVLTYHKKLLAEAKKEKEDLKAKVEKWHNSSKNLGKLLNTQMSANDKFGLGYGDHRYDGILSYENEVLQSVFMNKESDLENQPLYDRFVTAEGMHVPSESETQTSDFDTCESGSSVKTSESLPEPTVNKPKVVSQPKAWSDAPIIEEYETDSEYEHVSVPIEERETPSFANKQVNAVSVVGKTGNAVKALRQLTLQNKGIIDSGCSRHMTGNKAYLAEYQDFNGSPVAFGGSKGYITGKGKIKTRKLDFEDVCFVKEL
ncbi:hypothetical protein Tco_0347470 [Tanacetum coccineum]